MLSSTADEVLADLEQKTQTAATLDIMGPDNEKWTPDRAIAALTNMTEILAKRGERQETSIQLTKQHGLSTPENQL